MAAADSHRAIEAIWRIESAKVIASLSRIVGDVGLAELPSVRGDLLEKLGRFDEARLEFERAVTLTRNEAERTLLLERVATCSRL